MKTRLLSLLLVMLASVMPMKLWAADGNAEPYAVLSDNDTKDGQDDPLLARLYDNLALTTTDGNADGGNNDLSGSIDAAQTSLVRAMWNLQELPTDESYCVWMDSGIPALNTNTWSNSTQTQSMMGLYARLYHGIILANNYLANQNDGDLGKQAEARFLRALQYYYLMDHFGNVPLLTDTIDRQPLPVWEATPRDIELPTRVEMFNYIESELQDCLNSLPAANSYGRATTTAARLLLARLYLNSEVYTGTARWQEARSYAESVINGGTFQLAPIYRNLFMGDNDSNGAQQEIILPAIYDANTRTDYGGTTFLVASSFANGEGDNGTTQVWAGNVSKPDFVNKFFTQTADILYASPEQTASAANDDRALFYGINHSYELRNGDSFSDGFPYQKFTNVRSNGTSPVSSKFADTDFPLMRLGEAYLIAAEADARLNGSATSMQGTQYINMLRNRANAAASTTGYSLSDICDEWSREMGYEAVRRTTLIRFGRFGGQADYSWAWKGGSYDGSAFDAAKNTYPIPAVAVGGTPEPYAVLSDNNTKLTFFYDDQKDARGGMGVGPFLPDSERWGGHQGEIVTVVFDTSFANCTTLTSTASWFAGCGKLTSISDISNLKTDNVTDMCYMFSGCSSLTSLNVSGFKTDNVTDMNSMFNGCSSLTMLDVGGLNTANVTDMYGMFGGCSTLTSLDLSNFKTDNVTSMNRMFDGCSSLTSLDVSNFNTANVTYMGYMFWGCSSLTSLDVRNFKTDKVTEMIHMFSGCSNLTMLDIASFNTENVASMFYMFNGCSNLKSIYAGDGWSTAKVENGNGMFNNCTSLVGGAGTVYDANHTDHTYAHIDGGTSNPGYFTANNERVINGNFVTTDYSSFAYALEDNGTVIEITDNDIVEDSEEPGNRCIKIVSKDNATENWDSHFIIRIGEPLKEGQTYKFSMRAKASRNVSISSQARTTPDQYLHYRMLGNFDLTTGWQTYNVEGVVESEQAGCMVIALLLNVDKSSAEYFFDDISFRVNEAPSASPEPYAVLSENDTKLTFFYDTEKDARGGMDVGPFSSSSSNVVPWYNQRENITAAEFASSFANCTSITSTAYWFDGCNNMVSISGIQYLNTANVTNMHAMFLNCSSLTNLDVSGFNTANVTDMSYMFHSCSSLTSLNVSHFNTANVTDMSYMFDSCSSLTSLDVRGFSTTNVTNMGGMFWGCSALTSFDVSHFNTANVTDMRYMFSACSSLTSLDVSGFNTENVTDMSSMFERCFSLTSLDLNNFNTENVTNMHSMFDSCSRLASLNVSSFNTANVTDMGLMFSACYELTNLDVSHFNTENVTDIHGMFGGSSRLTSLDLSHFNTDKVTTMTYMFEGCSGLTSLDLSSFNTVNVTKFTNMFKECSNLKTIYVGSGWSTANVAEGTSMFYGCTNLVGGAGTPYDENHTDYTYAHIDGGTSNPGYFTSKDAPEGKTKVESIRFEQDGEYLTMTSPTDGAEIFYSMHYVNYGTTETPSGTRENGYRLWMPYSCTVDAYALKEGYENSDTTRFVYTKPAATYEFDGRVLRVNNGGETGPLWIRMSDIPYSETITAIVWNSEEKLTAYYIQGINNPNLLVYVNDASLAPQGVQNVVINGQAREIVLTDAQDGNNDWYAPQAFVAERISYTRNFTQSTSKGTSRGWESIALPFDVQTIQHESKGVIAPFNNSASNKHFWLRRLTDNGLQAATSIEANTPYIISMPNSEEYTADYNLNGRVTFSAQNVDVPATVTKVLALADSSIVMVPAMQRKERSSAVWALNVGEVRGSYFEGSVFERDYREVRPFEAYTVHRLENSQPAPRYIPIQEIGGTTGIDASLVNREEVNNEEWYDLEGRKLQGQPKQKGVYISKGKKVIVK